MVRTIRRREFLTVFGGGAVILLGAACAPAASPAPTAAPAAPAGKPTEAPAPAGKPAAPASPAAAAPKPTEAAKPAQAAPAAAPAASGATGERLVVGLAQWGMETPFAWRSAQLDKALWDIPHDPLIMRDPKTYSFKPGLATEWSNSPDFRTWTFKLRQGVMFHENYGEMTAEDVKFVIEQNLKPDSQGGSAPYFRAQLDKVDAPDKYTVVLTFKGPTWEVLSHFAQMTGYQNITSKKYLESVGEEKAAQHPIGTGPYRHVDGRQGEQHRFEAVPNHWRVTPAYKELIVRRMPDQASRLSAARSGEIDITAVTGDFIDQAKSAGLRIHTAENATQHWIVLPGQTIADKDDYSPQSPWVGEPNDPASQERAKKVRLALNLAVNKKAIHDAVFRGYGAETPFSYWYYPFHKGYSQEWKIPAYDANRAKQLLAEAGYPNGFEIKMTLTAQNPDAFDLVEAVALDWEKLGIRVRRNQEDIGSWLGKNRQRKTGVSGFSYAPPSAIDEPSLSWQRTVWSKGTFYLLVEGPFDEPLEAILRETDADTRTRMTAELGQRLYDGYYGVMLGMKAGTWAVTKKVGTWPTLSYALLENSYEYITP